MTGTYREYRQHRDRMIAYGRWAPFVPAGRTIAHLRMLIDDYGMGPRHISTLAGLGETIAERILGYHAAPVTKVRPETEAAILAVRPDLASMNPGASIKATGTHRRLQALMCNGWTIDRLAAEMGRSRSSVAHWLTRDSVAAKSAQAVAAVYQRLESASPPERTRKEQLAAARTRKTASDAGWASTWAWDEDTIDDPAAVPELADRATVKRTAAELLADADDLASFGETIEQTAARLGVTRKYLLEAQRLARKQAAA